MGENWERGRWTGAERARRRLPHFKWKLKLIGVFGLVAFVVVWIGAEFG